MTSKSKHMLHSLGQSESIAQLSLKAAALWCFIIADCDDQGRFRTDPRVMKWSICPDRDDITHEEIPALLEEMSGQDMVHLYSVDGQGYGQITNWWRYQRPRYARPSEYPPPHGWVDRVHIRQNDQDGEVVWRTENWKATGGFRELEEPQMPEELAEAKESEEPQEDRLDTTEDSTVDSAKNSTFDNGNGSGSGNGKGNGNGNINNRAPPAGVDDASNSFFSQNRRSLQRMGVFEPAAKNLAMMPHVTPEYLDAWDEYRGSEAARGNRLGAGWLIRQIEAGVEPPLPTG